MGVLDKVKEMKNMFAEIEAELEAQAAVPAAEAAPVVDLQPKIDALVKERDALRAAINAEIEDKKTDTKRLEAAVAPVEQAPVPVVPEAPAAEAPVEAPKEEAAPAPAEEVPKVDPTAETSAAE